MFARRPRGDGEREKLFRGPLTVSCIGRTFRALGDPLFDNCAHGSYPGTRSDADDRRVGIGRKGNETLSDTDLKLISCIAGSMRHINLTDSANIPGFKAARYVVATPRLGILSIVRYLTMATHNCMRRGCF